MPSGPRLRALTASVTFFNSALNVLFSEDSTLAKASYIPLAGFSGLASVAGCAGEPTIVDKALISPSTPFISVVVAALSIPF